MPINNMIDPISLGLQQGYDPIGGGGLPIPMPMDNMMPTMPIGGQQGFPPQQGQQQQGQIPAVPQNTLIPEPTMSQRLIAASQAMWNADQSGAPLGVAMAQGMKGYNDSLEEFRQKQRQARMEQLAEYEVLGRIRERQVAESMAARRISTLEKLKGTNPELADLIDLDPSAASRIIAGRLMPKEPKERRIIEQGGVSYYADTGERVIPMQTTAGGVGVPAMPVLASGQVVDPQNLTAGQKKADEKFSEDYVEFNARGGYADVEKQLGQLNEVAGALEAAAQDEETKGKRLAPNLTGPVLGIIPRSIRAGVNPASVKAQESVEEVVQRNLRLVLGTQFTEKEGDRLIARAYNPQLSEAENAKRVKRLMTQIDNAAKAKVSASKYFETYGTLAGWQGKMPSMSDFDPEKDLPSAAEPARAGGGILDNRSPVSPNEILNKYGLE
jgi:hypothetical protein